MTNKRTRDKSDRSDFERGPNDDDQITLFLIEGHGIVELVRHSFSEEYNVGLHNGLSSHSCASGAFDASIFRRVEAAGASWNSLLHYLGFNLVARNTMLATEASGRGKGTVALDDPFDTRLLFQSVDILRVVAQ